MKPERKPTRDAEGSIIKKTVTRRTSNGRTKMVTLYFARVRMNEYNAEGKLIKPHERKRTCETYQEAVDERRKLRNEILAVIEAAKHKPKETNDGRRLVELVDFYEAEYVKEAVFVGNKKVKGQKNPLQNTKRELNSFREFFGSDLRMSDLDYPLLRKYKEKMENEPYKVVRKVKLEPDEIYAGEIKIRGKQRFKYIEEWFPRKPATIHRYLSKLHRVLEIGIQNGYLAINPFKQGDALIDRAVEETRDRICSFEEEDRLYSKCVGRAEHLADVITIAIDTFARTNEFFSLMGSDLHFEDRFLRIRESNAKTLQTRDVPLSDRAVEAFRRVRGDRSDEEWNGGLVFPFNRTTSAWYTALEKAGIDDLRFHDLRATGITRMLDAGVPESIVMKFSGHKQHSTFMKYVRKDLKMIQEAAAAFSQLTRKRQIENSKGHLPLGANGEIALALGSDFDLESETVN